MADTLAFTIFGGTLRELGGTVLTVIAAAILITYGGVVLVAYSTLWLVIVVGVPLHRSARRWHVFEVGALVWISDMLMRVLETRNVDDRFLDEVARCVSVLSSWF